MLTLGLRENSPGTSSEVFCSFQSFSMCLYQYSMRPLMLFLGMYGPHKGPHQILKHANLNSPDALMHASHLKADQLKAYQLTTHMNHRENMDFFVNCLTANIRTVDEIRNWWSPRLLCHALTDVGRIVMQGQENSIGHCARTAFHASVRLSFGLFDYG